MRLLTTCLTPMESHKPMPGPLCPRGLSSLPLHYLFALLSGKWCDPRPQREPGRGLRTPFQVAACQPPAPAWALGCTQHPVRLCAGFALGRGPLGWGHAFGVFCKSSGVCRCPINVHSLMVKMVGMMMGRVVMGMGMTAAGWGSSDMLVGGRDEIEKWS